MQTLLLLSLILSAPAVEISLAPDQPLPYVYVDDPLILELQSSEDAEAAVQVTLQATQHPQPTQISLEGIRLRAKGNYWSAIKDMPGDRGYYAANVKIDIQGAITEKSAHFCRIDRVGDLDALPLSARNADDSARLALSAVGVRAMYFDASLPEIESRVKEAAALGAPVTLNIDCPRLSSPADVAVHLVQACGAAVARWEVDGAGDPAVAINVMEAMRKAGCTASIALAVTSPEAFAALTAGGNPACFRDTVFVADAPKSDDLPRMRQIAEDAGCEAWNLYVRSSAPSGNDPIQAALFIRQVWRNVSAGAKDTCFDAALAYDGEIRASVAYLNGMMHQFPANARFVERLDAAEGVVALLFRTSAKWLAVLWSENGDQSISVPMGDATSVVLTDAFNNPLPLPAATDGALPLSLTQAPLYLTGSGGPILSQAAKQGAAKIARQFAETARFQTLPAELLAAVASIAADPAGSNARPNFLALLRFIQQLEQEWHAKALPRDTAIPAIARLARLARLLCIVEQARGEAFVDPLLDTLARCEEYQSQYLTGSTGTTESRERGDWLLSEVRRLMDEAEELSAQEYKIEAGAVAALAEWRARGLESAAQTVTAAPTAAPTPAAPPEAAPETTPAVESPAVPPVKADDEQAKPATPEAAPPVEEPPAATVGPKEITHTVERGETPASIAAKYGVSLDVFAKENGLKRDARLRVGKKYIVRIPGEKPDAPKQPDTAAKPAKTETADSDETVHTVVKGDSPATIADKYGVSLDDFLRWNKLTKRSRLQVGQKLVVRKPGPADGAAPAKGNGANAPAGLREITHTIVKGDNPGIIAKKYGVTIEDFFKWNGISKKTVLHVGEQYKVYVPAKKKP